MKAVLWLTGGILLLLVIVFLIPGSVENLSLDKEKLLGGEYWRIGTYPFAHLTISHLIENLVGLALIGFIAFELKTGFIDYSATFFSSAFLAVLPLWLLVTFVMLGSSAAIYALFGFVSFGMKKFGLKARYVLIGLMLVIFGGTMLNFSIGAAGMTARLIQSLAHFSGLVFGIVLYGVFFLLKRHANKRKSRVLRGI